ncbi:gluconolactonase [Bradyrhizobium lablabi]|uniref:Gluconolactonase n=3 Tax=Nitrobacteraceae TaxID=41294 RepID=A0ABY0PBC4_9BRAD|nr:gluconolactonase [Bradyrhizobium ottawaense]SEE01099.1 gluconolactonase [Bradyrhizobium lablabi]SHL97008.1 gluconolactonase [Bradyrhizobium lablabi]
MTNPANLPDTSVDPRSAGLDRRNLLRGATALAATAVTMKTASAASVAPLGQTGAPTLSTEPLPLGPLPGSRYPDSHLESAKPKLSFGPSDFPAFAGTMAVERVATGFRWAEGPVYFAAGRYVLFSDIPNNRIMRFSEDDGHLSVYRQPSMNSNGNTIDREGRLITCEHSGRRITRTELDGSITIIADKYNGKKLNSPNDAVVASDGSIWFTDPVYGIGGYYEGIKAEPEQEKKNVYRMDPKSGDIKVVVDDFVEPNGITFSPDEKKLYVIDTGFTDGPDNPSHIRVFDVDVGSGKVSNGKVFAEMPKPSITDGMRCDTAGRVWCSVGWGDPKEDGVRCYTPDGELLGKIHIPETVANLCFGGQQRNRLYICGSTSLYAVYTGVQGAMKP